ncbi:MAG: hypothetical protein WBC74_05980 [Candidatus Omnitrophota bacterium]
MGTDKENLIFCLEQLLNKLKAFQNKLNNEQLEKELDAMICTLEPHIKQLKQKNE